MNGLVFNTKNIKIIFITLIAFFIFIGILNFNVTHLTTRFEFDSISYSMQLEKKNIRDIFHPHHLLYNYFKWLLFNLLKANGYNGGSLLVSQFFNSFMGALGITFLFLTIRYITKSIFPALVAGGVLSFSFGYWYCSTFGGVRVMGIAFLILLFFLLSYFVTSQEKDFKKNLCLIILISVVHSFVIFSHQIHTMFAVIVILSLFFKKDTLFNKFVYFAIYSLILIVIVGGIYYYIGTSIYHLKTSKGFYNWLISYTKVGMWGKLDSESVRLAKEGIERTFIGSLYKDNLFYGTIKNKDIINVFYYSLYVTGIYALIFSFRLFKKYLPIIVMCIAWLVLYVPFFVWWEPVNFEFWTYPLPAFLILLSLPISDLWNTFQFLPLKIGWRIFTGLVFSILILIFFWYNFFGTILIYSNISKSRYYNIIDSIKTISKDKDDFLVILGKDALIPNINYYIPREFLSIYHRIRKYEGDESAAIKDIVTTINEKLNQKRKVFIHNEVFISKKSGEIEKIFLRVNLSNIIDAIKSNFKINPTLENDKNFFKIERKVNDN